MAPRGHLLALGRGSLGDLFDDLRQTLVILHGHGAWGFELVLVGKIRRPLLLKGGGVREGRLQVQGWLVNDAWT